LNYKTHIYLLISILLISTLGFYLLAHGAVYTESALKAGEPTLWLKIEMVIGSILIWPISAFGWVFYLLFKETVILPFPITVFLLISGYYVLFFWFTHIVKKLKKPTPSSSN